MDEKTGDLGQMGQFEYERLPKDKIVPVLVELLHDENGIVRLDAVEALGKLGSAAKPTMPVIAESTKDDEVRVREVAGQALEKLKKSK